MNTCYIQTLADETIKTIGVRFDSTRKIYTYKTRLEDLKLGDKVIVSTPSEFKIVTVVRIDAEPQIDANSTKTFKWVIQKVDEEGYEKSWKIDRAFARQIKAKERDVHRAQAKAALAQMFGEGVDISKTLEMAATEESLEFEDETFDDEEEGLM